MSVSTDDHQTTMHQSGHHHCSIPLMQGLSGTPPLATGIAQYFDISIQETKGKGMTNKNNHQTPGITKLRKS